MDGASWSPRRERCAVAGRPWLRLRGKPAQAEDPTNRAASSALRGGAEEVAVVGEAGWCRLNGFQSPCPGRGGDGLETRSGGAAPRAAGPGGERPGRSEAEQGEAGWPEADAGLAGEG